MLKPHQHQVQRQKLLHKTGKTPPDEEEKPPPTITNPTESRKSKTTSNGDQSFENIPY
jgi:hypothetical protein